MNNCKVLIPFVDGKTGLAYEVNDVIELTKTRAESLEKQGLVEMLSANPNLLDKRSKVNNTPEDNGDNTPEGDGDDTPEDNGDNTPEGDGDDTPKEKKNNKSSKVKKK